MSGIGSKIVSTAARMMPQRIVDFLYAHRFNPIVRRAREWAAGTLGDSSEGVLVERGPLAGYRFAFSDSVAMWIGGHEPVVHDVIRKQLRPGAIAYDIGAHVGYTMLLMARVVGPTGRVIGYEPDPANYDLLVRNIEMNGLSSFVEARTVALGSEPGRGDLRRLELSILTQVEAGGQGPIEISTLDIEVYERGAPVPDLIVIDAEGAEESVFLGASRVLSEASPVIVYEDHSNRERIVEILGAHGYSATDIDISHMLFTKSAARV